MSGALLNTFLFNTTLFNQKTETTHQLRLIPEYIEIRDPATDKPVAFLSPEGDGLKADTCCIDNELNGECKLEFELPYDSEKWQYLTNDYRIIAGGREFIVANPDAVTASREGLSKWGKFMAKESWVLLNKDYAESGISNDPSTPSPPALSVIIVSGGSDLSGGRYAVGSAGHALYALLDGTGWTVGTVDVEGTFDLETEKESILQNINKVQELWGGNLVWDSLNKTVSLRSESTWLNYTGFGARYAKNLKNIERIDDREIISRCYCYGADDLNISSVNGGKEYLDNNTFTSRVLIGTYINQEISDATQLKAKGEEYLAKMCKPRHTYKFKMLDLRSIPGYEHETFDIGHLIDIVDETIDINTQARIIRYKYAIFQPWLCDIDVGDPIEKIAASIAQTIKASDYVKSSIKPNTSVKNLLKAMLDTAATIINGASGDYTLVDGVSTWSERVSGSLTGNMVRITPDGMIISSDGGMTWDLAISGESINASMINTGTLNAAIVNILSNNGKFQIVDNGLKIYDASDVLRIHIGEYATGVYGCKFMHADGSYTTIDANGLRRHLSSGTKDYMYLVSTGTGSTEYDSSSNVQECYLGLTRFLKWTYESVSIAGYITNLSVDATGHVTSYNISTTTFKRFRPVIQWDATKNMDYSWGGLTSDAQIDSITESDILTYIPEKWVQLPDDFKGKSFVVTLAISGFDLPNYLNGETSGYPVRLTGNPKFLLKVTDYDYTNGKFKVKAYYRVKNKWSRSQVCDDGVTYNESDQIFYARGIEFTYTAVV